jgi:selenocysteine-specific elongation factor
VADPKSVVIGTAGHIDHGKSALVQALTGTDPDRLEEEKTRGITIDIGFAHAQLGDVDLAFVDVPGHERFVKNMLAGVGGIDLVLVVVAADESVMPQTREHFEICRLLEIPAGLVALTKADLVGRESLEAVRLDVRELVAGSFLDGAPVVAVSSKTRDGLDELREALLAQAHRVPERSPDGPARLPIDRVFTVKGFGTVVTGTLVSGRIRRGDQLAVVPDASGGRVVVARGLQVHGRRTDEAVAGQRTAVNLAAVGVEDLERGQALVMPGSFEATRVADASLELLPGVRLRQGARIRFHQGTAEVIGRVAIIGPPPAEGTSAISPDGRGFVRLRLERPVALGRGDRYVLRAYSTSRTIGGGRVLDPAPPRAATRTAAAMARCLRLAAHSVRTVESAVSAAALMVEEAGLRGLPLSALVSRCGVPPRQIDAHVVELVRVHGVERIADRLVAMIHVDRARSALVDLLAAHHRALPLSDGVPREEARARICAGGSPSVFEHIVHGLAGGGVIAARDRLKLAAHHAAPTPEEERARALVEEVLRRAGLTPPNLLALASRVDIPAALAERVLKLLQRDKRVVKIDSLFFHEEALQALKSQVAAIGNGRPDATIDVAAFKQRFGVSRKYAIPLLEYLDRERVTRRTGDVRLVL